jgi:hypothetical protein
MKVLAIGAITKQPTPERQAELMSKEVPATLQLYLDAKIEQFWFRQDRLGVVFYMQAESVDAAKAEVDKLPLTAAGFMTFDFIPIGPLAPLGRLIQSN